MRDEDSDALGCITDEMAKTATVMDKISEFANGDDEDLDDADKAALLLYVSKMERLNGALKLLLSE